MSEQAPAGAAPATSTLEQLQARFERHHQDPKVASGKPYLSIAQVVNRLNVVVGLSNWTHVVLREGVWPESDEIWVYGRLVGWIDGERFEREDYGSKKITRSRMTKEPTQLGDDHQGAKSDSLKRCAKQIGVGAYLSDDVGAVSLGPAVDPITGEQLVCVVCDKPLDEVKFQGNKTWPISELAQRSRALTRTAENPQGGLLCADHFFERRAEMKQRGAA